MSTRGCVAIPLGDVGFKGVYQHFDSYPTGLGANLWHIYQDYFKENVDGMIKELILDHPSGWSSIRYPGGDDSNPGTETGMVLAVMDKLKNEGATIVHSSAPTESSNHQRFGECYCHSRGEGGENDESRFMIWIKGNPEESRIDPLFIEFAYVLHKMGMDIYSNYSTGETFMEKNYDGSREYESVRYDMTFATMIPWDDETPDWKEIEQITYRASEDAKSIAVNR